MHWAEVEEIRGGGITEEADRFLGFVQRAVEVADNYQRELKFPTLMAELPCEVLDGATTAADWFFVHGETRHEHFPTVKALTFAARALLYQTMETEARMERKPPDERQADEDGFEDEYRRLCIFVFAEKYRRLKVYEKMTVAFDPWDTEAKVVFEGQDPAAMREFRRFLGYDVE